MFRMHSLTALSQRSPRAIVGPVRASTRHTQALLPSRRPHRHGLRSRSETHAAAHPDSPSGVSSPGGGGGLAAASASTSGQEQQQRPQSVNAEDEEVRRHEQAPMWQLNTGTCRRCRRQLFMWQLRNGLNRVCDRVTEDSSPGCSRAYGSHAHAAVTPPACHTLHTTCPCRCFFVYPYRHAHVYLPLPLSH